MPRLPRDLDGTELARDLRKLGYMVVRQTGSHMRLSCEAPKDGHHVTIPAHSPLKIGTLNGILDDVAAFHSMTKEELVDLLFS